MNIARCLLAITLLTTMLAAPQQRADALTPPPSCVTTGWDANKINLKDHTVFSYGGAYYIASIAIAATSYEKHFAYARSTDLCNWEDLGLILNTGSTAPWDAWRIWAPFVIAENGVYYMFYTGVTKDVTQSIMLATSTNPADPAAWQPRGLVFQPNHSGMNWPGLGRWSDARDPTVLKVGTSYYMYYTGGDASGGIVGVATASSMLGPWQDSGATLTIPNGMPESAGVFGYDGSYYLFYNRVSPSSSSPELRIGASPLGPWSAAQPLNPGWAHEFWQDINNRWMVSYLTTGTTTTGISIAPVDWDKVIRPPQPFFNRQVWHMWMPLSLNRANP